MGHNILCPKSVVALCGHNISLEKLEIVSLIEKLLVEAVGSATVTIILLFNVLRQAKEKLKFEDKVVELQEDCLFRSSIVMVF
jgi:hypothetical protein